MYFLLGLGYLFDVIRLARKIKNISSFADILTQTHIPTIIKTVNDIPMLQLTVMVIRSTKAKTFTYGSVKIEVDKIDLLDPISHKVNRTVILYVED